MAICPTTAAADPAGAPAAARGHRAPSGSGAEAETFHALPLPGYENNLLGVLLIGSSRRDLVELEASLRCAPASWWRPAASCWAFCSELVGHRARHAARAAAGRERRQSRGRQLGHHRGDRLPRDEIGQLARAFNRMTHELVEQRERLVQAERVAAWRELARRLAHELKNPLFPLQITVENMQRARESYPDQFDEVFREGTATLLAELANLKQIIGRFSDFAKMPAPEMQPVDFNQPDRARP